MFSVLFIYMRFAVIVQGAMVKFCCIYQIQNLYFDLLQLLLYITIKTVLPCPFYSYSNLMVFWTMVYAGAICFIFNSMCWFSNNLIGWNISKPISPLTIDSNCCVHSEYVFDPCIQVTFSKSIPTLGLYLN
jgi:hypothetical protein